MVRKTGTFPLSNLSKELFLEGARPLAPGIQPKVYLEYRRQRPGAPQLGEAMDSELIDTLKTQKQYEVEYNSRPSSVRDLQFETIIPDGQGGQTPDCWNDVAAMIQLELQNPLAVIKTYTNLLPSRHDDHAFCEEYSRMISVQLNRLAAFMDRVHDCARSPRHRFEPMDIRHVLKTALFQARENAQDTVTNIDWRLTADLPPIHADEAQLIAAVLEVLTNAFEATKLTGNGMIEIAAELRTDRDDNIKHLAVIISDNGAGIKPSIRNKVFSPFCTTKNQGLGIGLPLIERVMKDHNGEIEMATSYSGSRVTLLLPAHVL